MVEMFIAAVAMLIWAAVEPGTVRAVAFNVLLIAGISTVLFNGNPLLRYDAYYALAEFLEIPNLATRGNRYVTYLIQRFCLGMREIEAPESRRGEIVWLVAYTLAAFFYRIFISIQIILFIAGRFFFIGVALAGWLLATMVIGPLYKVIRQFAEDPRLQRVRGRAMVTVTLAATIAAAVLFLLPFPAMTVVEGVVWVPERSQIHASGNGVIVRLVAEPGTLVESGQPLILCADPEVPSRVRVLEAQETEYEARYRLALASGELTETKILRDELERIAAELRRARERQEELLIRSPGRGYFVIAEPKDLPGRFVQRGVPLAYVVDYAGTTARVVVPQRDIDLVRHRTRSVELRLASTFDTIRPSRVLREVPEATKELPSLALSLEGGGRIALDPKEKDAAKAFEKIFQFDLELPADGIDRIGERVYARFRHQPEPLGFRWYRDLRRLLLKRFAF